MHELATLAHMLSCSVRLCSGSVAARLLHSPGRLREELSKAPSPAPCPWSSVLYRSGHLYSLSSLVLA